jgi:oligosaccharide repeat unit polymerase
MAIETLGIFTTGVLGVGILLVAIAKLIGKIPAHVLLYCVTWTPCMFFSHFIFDAGIRPKLTTTVILFGAWWIFLLGSLIPLAFAKKRSANYYHATGAPTAIPIIYILAATQLAAIYFELSHFQSSSQGFRVVNFLDDLVRLRLAGVTMDVQLPPLLGTFRWAHVFYIPLAIYIRFRRQISRTHLCGIVLFAAVSACLHFTRAPLVQLSIVILISWSFIYKPSGRVIFFVLGGAGLLLGSMFIYSQNAIIARDVNAHVALGESLVSYFGASPFAYETIVDGHYPRAEGIYTVDALNFFLNKVGVIDEYPGLARSYIYYPVVTNVYTYLDAFTIDFGVFGALAGALLVGAGCSTVYVIVRNSQNVGLVILYAYLSYCCLMSPINNEFIRMGVFVTIVVGWCVGKLVVYRYVLACQRSFKIQTEAHGREIRSDIRCKP